tara:strand:+ start:52 stop:195 length:144 start_codon:yes stop_codon:yes gene_type:complete
MRFYHTVIDKNGEVKENYLVSNSNRRLSLELSAELINGSYNVTPTNI